MITIADLGASWAVEAPVRHVARKHGDAAQVRTQRAPAWTTDWMTDAGRERLRSFGIARLVPGIKRAAGRAHGDLMAGPIR